MKKENIYIDLSKCSEEERKYIRTKIFNSEFPVATLTRHILENMIVRKFNGTPYLLINEFDHWQLDRCYMDKTELTYPEFIKLFEGGEEQKNGWIDAREEQPLCVSTGNWDGKQSDIVIAETFTGKKFLAQCYEGFMDGSKFYDWYQVDEINSSDWLITESVSRWMKIPF